MICCTPGVPWLLEIIISVLIKVLQYMSMAMLQKMLRIFELVSFGFVAFLQSTTSPLEIAACICVVDALEFKCHGIYIVTAIFILRLPEASGMYHPGRRIITWHANFSRRWLCKQYFHVRSLRYARRVWIRSSETKLKQLIRQSQKCLEKDLVSQTLRVL